MKKFLVFLMSIVIIVSFGLVTYYFLRNDEVINFKNYLQKVKKMLYNEIDDRVVTCLIKNT